MWLMHFASELSYPFIWYSKTFKQLEVLMKVLTLKMFIFIQLAFTFVSVGIPTDTLAHCSVSICSVCEIIDRGAEMMNVTSCVDIIPIPGHRGSSIKDNELTGFE